MVWTWQWPAAVVAGALVAPVVAQTSEPESTAVLQEVRLLRQAIETLARAGVGAHIYFGRLQIQEQRTQVASRELKDVDTQLSHLTTALENSAISLRQTQDQDTTGLDAAERADHARELSYLKQHVESLETRRARLMTERADVEHRVAIEQAQWQALNQKLDDLERMIATRPR